MVDPNRYNEEELKKLFKKYKITAKKHMGDDAYSWAVFENSIPRMVGLTKSEVNYYKKSVLRIILERGEKK